MTTPEPTFVSIATPADIDALLDRLPSLGHRRVVVEVPEGSQAFTSAAEFSRVLVAGRMHGVDLSLTTEDRLRRELARMLGWSVLGSEASDGAAESGAAGQHEGDTTADLATYVPTAVHLGPGGATLELGGGAARPAQATRPVPRTGRAPRPASVRHPTTAEERDGDDLVGRRFPIPRPPRAIALAASGIALVAVLLVVGGILFYALPTATVTLVPTEHPISATLTYGVAAPGANYDITVKPTDIGSTTTFDKAIKTTGERFEPDGTATGSVMLSNPQTQEVVVPAKTELAGSNGMTYVTQQPVTVPPADPFDSGKFGSASVAVAATKPGPDGNAEPGTIVGQLGNGLFYSNKDPIEGGTQKRIPVVSQADIDALTQAATKDLQARAEQEFKSKIPSGSKLVPNSMQKGKVNLTFNHKAGEDAEQVAVHGTIEVKGQVFDPAKLHAQARDEAGRRLAAQAGPGVIILSDRLKIGEPTPANDAQTAFTIRADAVVRSVISDEERRTLATRLVGKDMQDAEQILAGVPNAAGHSIRLEPTWLPKRMPQLASHVRVVVSSDEQPSAP